MKDVLKIFSIFTLRQKRYFIFIFLLMLIGAAFESVGIAAILPLISLMGKSDYLLEDNIVAVIAKCIHITSHYELIIACTAMLIVFYIIKNIFITWELYIQRRFVMTMQLFFAKEILSTYLLKPYSFHVQNNSAKLLRDVNSGPNSLCNSILMPIFYMVSELVTTIAIWLMLILIDAFTAILVALIMAVIIIAIIRLFRRKIVKQGIIQNSASVDYLKWINQGLGAIKETKILGKEHFFGGEFAKSYARFARANQICAFLTDVPRIIIEMLVVGGMLSLILFKLSIGDNPSEIISILGVLAMAAFRLMPSANRIVSFYNAIKHQMPFFYELYDVLLEIKNRASKSTFGVPNNMEKKLAFNRVLSVENISFRYTDNTDLILDDVSFEISKGSFVGLIGPSGAGKTTLVDIMLGLLKPIKGRLLCDNCDINDNIRGWQEKIAYVPQDIYLMDGSIKENIALGEPADKIDNELLFKVLHMAELDECVKNLPDGLDTFVGERGVKLSGGQRQRIGIARALYQKPEVLFLDEATSALDNETEKAITETILKFKGEITIIAIAHRVSTLDNCDYKIKLENGHVEKIY